MNDLKTNRFLEEEKLTTLMKKHAIPCIISLSVAALYNIVDQIFIANADYLGSYGNAANTVVYPLTVAVMIGDGCCAFVSLSLGAGSFLAQFSLVLAMAAINNMIRKYSALDSVFGQEQYTQIPMAVVGIVMKFFQIVISIVIGMAAGCIPIVGYNMGAGRKDRALYLSSVPWAGTSLYTAFHGA